MSLRSHLRRGLVAAGLATTAVMAAVAPAQAATTVSKPYRCTYPLVGPQNVTADITHDFPAQWFVFGGQPTPPASLSLELRQALATGFDVIQASSISGSVALDLRVTAPGFDQLVALRPTFAELPAAEAATKIAAAFAFPSLQLPAQSQGQAEIRIERLALNLRAKRADGSAIVVPQPATSPDSDGDPNTFDVPCLPPAGSSNLLASVQVTSAVCGGGTCGTPPSRPGKPSATTTQTTAKLTWAASTDDVGVVAYDVYLGVGAAQKVAETTTTSATVAGLMPGTSYVFTVKARDAAGNVSQASEALTVVTPICDCIPLQPPTNVRFESTTATSVTVRWTAPAGGPAPVGYDVTLGTWSQRTTGTSATFSGLVPNTLYSAAVRSRGPEGDVSTAATATVKTFAQTDTLPPSKPGPIVAVPDTKGGKLTWPAATDNVGVTGYDVFQAGQKIGTTTVPSYAVTGLAPGSYAFTVQAFDAAGNRSLLSSPATLTVPPPPCSGCGTGYRWKLKGSAALRTTARGTLPITGKLAADRVDVATGKFGGTLTVDPARATLTAYGFLPVQAQLALATLSGGTTGAFGPDGKFTSTTPVGVKLQKLTVLGVAVAIGPNCGSKSTSNLTLGSTGVFSPQGGGPLTGSFTIPPLSDCGQYGSLANSLLAGGANTIAVTATGDTTA